MVAVTLKKSKAMGLDCASFPMRWHVAAPLQGGAQGISCAPESHNSFPTISFVPRGGNLLLVLTGQLAPLHTISAVQANVFRVGAKVSFIPHPFSSAPHLRLCKGEWQQACNPGFPLYLQQSAGKAEQGMGEHLVPHLYLSAAM